MLFLKPTPDQVLKTKLLFQIFGTITGLKVNLLKSELAITLAPANLTQNLANILGCKPSSFPLKYLGLPLLEKRPNRTHFLPVIDKITAALSGWRASLLSIGGRIILVNAVLTLIPQYFMSAFILPKWVIRAVDRIRRTFLWHGHKPRDIQAKRLYMVNWKLATRPRKLGGLGVHDIQIANQSLLMKKMWHWHNHEDTWWKQPTVMADPADRPWNDPNGLDFWKSIASIEPAFNCSIAFDIGDGQTTKFWHDNWLGSPLKLTFPNLYLAAHNKHVSVALARDATGWSLQFSSLTPLAQTEKDRLMSLLQQYRTTPTQSQDAIKWIRHPGFFSTASAYHFLANTPSPQSSLQYIWQIKAPLRVQIFAWLMHTNRLATLDNLAHRGWILPNMCIMCKSEAESVNHLFQTCALATQIRNYIFSVFALTHSIPPKFVAPNSATMLIDPSEKKNARNWEIVTCFILWRERCRRTFSNKFETHLSLVREIRLELSAWFPK